MKVTPTEIPEVLLIEPVVHTDRRGYFLESFNERSFSEQGLDLQFVQDNHSRSNKGVVRGLHFQVDTPQGKLVRVARGEVFDVAVDVRRGSPSFGHYVSMTLSDANQRQLYVPPGFAHGFCVLSDVADLLYKCTGFYDPADEQGLAWDDPEIAIEWPVMQHTLSEKDYNNPALSELSRLPSYEAS